MTADIAISMNQLQELIDEVRKTQRAHTLQVADGVVAVVKPQRKPAPKKVKRPRASSTLSHLSIEDVFGSVPTPPHLRGRDIDEMIREAKDERAERFLKQ